MDHCIVPCILTVDDIQIYVCQCGIQLRSSQDPSVITQDRFIIPALVTAQIGTGIEFIYQVDVFKMDPEHCCLVCCPDLFPQLLKLYARTVSEFTDRKFTVDQHIRVTAGSVNAVHIL